MNKNLYEVLMDDNYYSSHLSLESYTTSRFKENGNHVIDNCRSPVNVFSRALNNEVA